MGCCPFLQNTQRSRHDDLSRLTYVSPAKVDLNRNRRKPELHTKQKAQGKGNMIETQTPKSKRPAALRKAVGPRLFFWTQAVVALFSVKSRRLGQRGHRNCSRPNPDGIVVDAEAGHIYWTNMGNPIKNDGSIERVDLDGKNRATIIPEGSDIHPKAAPSREGEQQIVLVRSRGDARHALQSRWFKDRNPCGYQWSDPRPGPDATKWCVGITVDPKRGKVYWTQKGPTKGGSGSIFRANIEIPKGATPANRSDIESSSPICRNR